MENREVPSRNSLHLLLRPSCKSLIYIKNNKGPRIDPWTLALTSGQDEHWLFRTTLCFLLRRNSRKMLMISLLTPFLSCFKLRSSCHTFSKAFVMSINILHTSNPLSNAFKILWLLEMKSLMQESPDLNSDWFGERRL